MAGPSDQPDPVALGDAPSAAVPSGLPVAVWSFLQHTLFTPRVIWKENREAALSGEHMDRSWAEEGRW